MRVEFDFWLEINNLRNYSLSTDEIVDSVEYFFTDLLPKYQLASEGWRKRYRKADGLAKFKQDVKKICQRNEFYCGESVGPYLDPDDIAHLFDELSGLAKTLSPLGYFSDYIGWSVNLGDSFLESWTELSKEFSDALCIPRFPEQGVAFDKKVFSDQL